MFDRPRPLLPFWAACVSLTQDNEYVCGSVAPMLSTTVRSYPQTWCSVVKVTSEFHTLTSFVTEMLGAEFRNSYILDALPIYSWHFTRNKEPCKKISLKNTKLGNIENIPGVLKVLQNRYFWGALRIIRNMRVSWFLITPGENHVTCSPLHVTKQRKPYTYAPFDRKRLRKLWTASYVDFFSRLPCTHGLRMCSRYPDRTNGCNWLQSINRQDWWYSVECLRGIFCDV
jgi:hypothetical protein